jgi:hypothetical protein
LWSARTAEKWPKSGRNAGFWGLKWGVFWGYVYQFDNRMAFGYHLYIIEFIIFITSGEAEGRVKKWRF